MAETGSQGVKLSCRQFQGGNLVRVSGVVDETLVPSKLVTLAGHGYVVIDLDGVHRVTSFGVREWTRALRDLTASYLGFVNCRPAVVAQLNTVRGFDGAGEVITLFAPYVCPRCDVETDHLLDLRTRGTAIRSGELPEVPCPECGATTEFDDIPSTYFAFARSKADPSPPLEIHRLLATASGERLSEPLTVRKEVRGTVTAIWLTGLLDKRARLRRIFDGIEGDVVMLMGGLTGCTAEGLSQLDQGLGSIDVPVHLAHVAPDTAVWLTQGEHASQGVIVSMLIAAVCSACCGELELIVGPDDLGEDGPAKFSCRNCGSAEPPLLDENAESIARSRLVPEVPLAIERYLNDVFAPTTTTVTPSPSAFEERYEIVEPLAGGGMAEVALARQRGEAGFSKLVVIKQLRDRLADDQAAVDMFVREARLAARISHPNVVQIFNLGRRDGRHFIAMEYVEGWDLRALMVMLKGMSRPFPPAHALRIAAAVAAGLHAAHTTVTDANPESVVHCDVSSRNILISNTGAIKLTDFGIARALRHLEGSLPGTVWGTPAYMAPEQMHPRLGALSPATDIYGLGVVLLEMLTTERPSPCTIGSELSQWLDEAPPRVDELRPGLPSLITKIVGRAIARRPEARYSRARQMQDDLEIALDQVGAMPGSTDFSRWLESTSTSWEDVSSLSMQLGGTGGHTTMADELEAPRQPTPDEETGETEIPQSDLERRLNFAIERLQRGRRSGED